MTPVIGLVFGVQCLDVTLIADFQMLVNIQIGGRTLCNSLIALEQF